MNGDTWAIVAATGLGPILAVLITFWRESRSSLKARRLWVFRTLMATRRVGISPEHVNALNLVEVDFYGCERVQEHWKVYKDHLFGSGPEDDAWREKKERLLANMLFEMATALRFRIPAMEIFKGGYAPKGWAHRDSRQFEAMEYIYELSKGTKIVPIWLRGVTPQSPSQPPLPAESESQRQPSFHKAGYQTCRRRTSALRRNSAPCHFLRLPDRQLQDLADRA